MKSLLDDQFWRNKTSREDWDTFSHHRENVTNLILRGRGRLCVFGAGNCNDIEILKLTSHFEEVHLVDIDVNAMEYGTYRQGVQGHDSLYLHSGIDLTGIVDKLDAYSLLKDASALDLEECIKGASEYNYYDLPRQFDTVVSTCLLSQLIYSVAASVGPSHPQYYELVCAVRNHHLKLLKELLALNGFGVLVTDVVSSDLVPYLGDIANSSLENALEDLIAAGLFMEGLHPQTLENHLRANEVETVNIVEFEKIPPWRWKCGTKQYAIIAMCFKKSGPVT